MIRTSFFTEFHKGSAENHNEFLYGSPCLLCVALCNHQKIKA